MKGGYFPTIGIECHVQLNTLTKLFSSESNDARLAKPNTAISPICFGFPGVLPVLNKQAVLLAIRAGLALNAEINTRSFFDRKHYLYPDLPKGYQISQFHQPIVGRGYVEVPLKGGGYEKIGITRAHLEEDAGKLTHPKGSAYSYVDLNRAGTPLMEIVSEPDIHSAETAKGFAQELYYLMKYAKVSNVDLYHGNMRFDVNISIAEKGSTSLGIRTEIKNLNSFKSVKRCVDFEIERQTELRESGQEVIQETRGWDEIRQKTVTQRGKEESHDYRYFPDPDLPAVIVEEAEISAQRKLLPILPKVRRERFSTLKIDSSQIESLINDMATGDLLLSVMANGGPTQARRIANWLTVDLPAILDGSSITMEKLTADNLGELAKLAQDGSVNSSQAKLLLAKMLSSTLTPSKIAENEGWLQLKDTEQLEEIVHRVLADNPKAISDYLRGNQGALHFIVGQAMKATAGRADPKSIENIARESIVQK